MSDGKIIASITIPIAVVALAIIGFLFTTPKAKPVDPTPSAAVAVQSVPTEQVRPLVQPPPAAAPSNQDIERRMSELCQATIINVPQRQL